MTTRVTNDNIDLSSITNAFVEWQAVITADGSTTTNVEAGKGYIIDTSSFSHTITLPSSPKKGDTISIKDYADSFNLNAVTVNLNGSKIEGNVSTNTFLKDERGSYVLFYIDNTKGWNIFNESASTNFSLTNYIAATGGTLIEDGNYNVHVFKNDGCFTVTNTGPGASTVDYVVVAGGGGGGSGPPAAGGGGAGGYRTNYPSCCAGLPVTTTTYPVTVGAGGISGSAISQRDSGQGSNSVFSTITSAGGGGGGTNPGPADPNPYPGGGKNGGSGGGAGPSACSTGSGNTPPTSPSQGNPGGTAGSVPNPGTVGGGGGGAGAAGSGAPGYGNGGIGASTGIFGCIPALKIKCYGTPGPAPGRYFAGGGGGSRNTPVPVRQCASTQINAGPSAAGGGGRGSCGTYSPSPAVGPPSGPTNGGPATANTGGGGGGGGDNSGTGVNAGAGEPGGSGAKGIVIIRYRAR